MERHEKEKDNKESEPQQQQQQPPANAATDTDIPICTTCNKGIAGQVLCFFCFSLYLKKTYIFTLSPPGIASFGKKVALGVFHLHCVQVSYFWNAHLKCLLESNCLAHSCTMKDSLTALRISKKCSQKCVQDVGKLLKDNSSRLWKRSGTQQDVLFVPTVEALSAVASSKRMECPSARTACSVFVLLLQCEIFISEPHTTPFFFFFLLSLHLVSKGTCQSHHCLRFFQLSHGIPK